MNQAADERARALAVFPAGISNGEFGLPEDDLVVMERGEGCTLWDTSGREWLDFSMGWGSVLVGHARPEVVAAVSAQAPLGSNFAYLNSHALAVAEEIRRACPAAERLRFCASGTEATMYCERVARAHTGRDRIIKFEGAYHGATETGVTSLFPQRGLNFPEPELTSAGTPAAARQVLVAPFNDAAALRSILAEHAHEVAAVIVEPLQRCTPPAPGFLEAVREACSASGVLLIFDEVVTGFRLAYGGAQEYYGVVPDLVAYGKALGGGYPIGAFAGAAAVMENVNEHRIGGDDYVWMASTLGGNPISTAAARATLGVLRGPGVYERLHALGHYLREAMREVLRRHGVVGQVIGDGPLAQVVFTDAPVTDYRQGARADRRRARTTMLGLFRRRVFLNPMGTKLYLSLAHDEAACDELARRLDAVLAEPMPA
ncbi:MAG TPA: aminotransferase class III-fold pyridoxal phosphate-dependent enzyme [Geminicoccaceae bacterium]|nr:aminotransferase class III-fold pyridoxal phosphate-dependent enzyme [Geminicoccaceae bacterium]